MFELSMIVNLNIPFRDI